MINKITMDNYIIPREKLSLRLRLVNDYVFVLIYLNGFFYRGAKWQHNE